MDDFSLGMNLQDTSPGPYSEQPDALGGLPPLDDLPPVVSEDADASAESDTAPQAQTDFERTADFDEDLHARADNLESLKQKIDPSKVSQVRIMVILATVVIVVVFLGGSLLSRAIKAKAAEEEAKTLADKVTSAVVERKVPRLLNESLELEPEVYKDSLIVEKYILLEEGSCNFYFSGRPLYFDDEVMFEVTPKEYNAIPNGSKVLIQFQIVKIKDKSGKVTDFMTNVEIKN